MKYNALTLLSEQLVQSLTNCLQILSEDWWQKLVIDQLTYQQQNYARDHQYRTISQLDLAALLRVADQNWYDLSRHYQIPTTTRNWLKEAQTIRNRWAHAPAEGLPDDMCYRDLDTIGRLLEAFGANTETLEKLNEEKTQLLNKIANTKTTAQEQQTKATNIEAYKPGDMIFLKAEPSKTGAIIAVLTGDPENRYQVFHDGNIGTYYQSQLEPVNSSPTRATVTRDSLHAAMTALQLRHPSTTHLYSLFASRINFVPYQFRPVLKLIQADRPRMLIADEVGVGKTIEAGLILKELQARRELKTVLVICPKPLVAECKWQQEMKRFDERFEHLDSAALRYCIEETHLDGLWPQQYARAIVPYSLLDENLLHGKGKQRGLLALDPPPVFDLVIVDEAHAARNSDTWAHRNVRYFCENAEAVVLMSATPIQLRDHDLYNLLSLLRPDVITSKQAFLQMSEPNPHLNAAIAAARAATADWKGIALEAIENSLATDWGRGVLINDPRMQQACDVLLDDDDSPETRLTLIRQLEELYTFAPFINRTRRRDIGTTFTLRKPETVSVEFTPEQAGLHHDLLDLLARMLVIRHGNANLKFLLSTVRRQISSCVFGLAPLLQALLNRHLSQLELGDVDDENGVETASQILAEFRTEIDAIIKQANQLTQGEDPKLQAFMTVIADKQKLENNKLLVFTCFRHTWEYLHANLKSQQIRVGLINGQIPDDERRALRDRFSKPKTDPTALDVLLSSEVGCEGLDYQFCDALVNYDLPWNPMRVEQRIGRIDRYGQLSESVVIYNFITPGTVDAEIYERCLLRIGIFQQALGGSEEILGRLTQEIKNIAENFTLTAEEQAKRLQQLSDNEIRTLQEQARLEEEQSKLFGLGKPQNDEDMIKQASSFWLAPVMLANLISRYLQTLGASNIPASLGQKATTLQLGKDLRDKLLADAEKLKLTGETAQSWKRWLKGNDPYLALTFSQQTAAEQRDLLFVTPNHPLAQQAAHSIEPTTPLICNLKASNGDLHQGQHPYAIYRWQKRGLKEDFTFQPIVVTPELTSQMLALMESAQALDDDTATISSEQENALEKSHYQRWQDARAEHIEQVQQHARARLDSLATTHAARMALLQEQHDTNPNDKIQRMRSAQMDAAARDYQQHKEQLEQAAQQADILAEAVLFGILEIRN